MRLASILALSTVLSAACGTAPPTVPSEPANATVKSTEHEGMDHGDMKGMDHADMKGMDHADMKGAYACPMHPDVTSDHAGECPKCGMAMVEKDKAGHDHADGSDDGHEAH